MNDYINKFIADKLQWIAESLPTEVETNPASFQCGLLVGFKTCLLQLDQLLEDGCDHKSDGDEYRRQGKFHYRCTKCKGFYLE